MRAFENVGPIDRAAAEVEFASGDSLRICKALVSLAFHDPDWHWVQDICLRFLNDNNPEIGGVSATCLGHLARIHGKLDRERVVAALRNRLDDPEIGGRVEDALDDISESPRFS